MKSYLRYIRETADPVEAANQIIRDNTHLIAVNDAVIDSLMFYLIEKGYVRASDEEKRELLNSDVTKTAATWRDRILSDKPNNPHCVIMVYSQEDYQVIPRYDGILTLVRVKSMDEVRSIGEVLSEGNFYKKETPVKPASNGTSEDRINAIVAAVVKSINKKQSISASPAKDSDEVIPEQVITAKPVKRGRPKTKAVYPKTARAAVLTQKEKFEIMEFPVPEINDNEILVRVEGCGVCGTDAHEFKRDPFGLIPVVLGHEGTGEIVAIGKNVTEDSAGKPLALGDRIVTCMIFRDNPDITMYDLNRQNVGGADVYGLLPDDDVHLNGYFSDYIVIRQGSSIFNVSDLDLDMRMLIEPAAVIIHALERAKSTGILRFNSRVLVQGCGPIGLLCIAALRTMGTENIVAVDGVDSRLEFARIMGADKTVNFKKYKNSEKLTEAVKDAFGGKLADFVFQCTGSPAGHSNSYGFVRSGGGLCELGFFIDAGDATINPHFDICSKEITIVGSWVYTLRDYAETFDFLKRAKAIGLPIEKLITHKYPLEEINEALKMNLSMEGLKIAIVN